MTFKFGKRKKEFEGKMLVVLSIIFFYSYLAIDAVTKKVTTK